MPPLQPQTATSTVKDTQRAEANRVISKIADNAGTQSDALVAALEAVRAAIAAKPSA